MNLLNDLKAPLFVELDVSNVQNYIDTKIDTRLHYINDNLDDKIEALIDNKITVDNLDKTKLDNNERVSGFISDLKSLEEIEKNLKNLKNENNQLKEDFKEWKNNGKRYCRLYLLFDVLF
jgi:DNA repair exonuclease SbcCD ATPase subunit